MTDEWSDDELEQLLPAVEVPEPPPFGWVFAVHKLTAVELDMVNNLARRMLENSTFLDHELAVAAYGAVALARRVDRKKYPWSTAELLMPDDIRIIQPRRAEPEPADNDDDQEQLDPAGAPDPT